MSHRCGFKGPRLPVERSLHVQPEITCCVRRTYDRLWKEAMEELVALAREEDLLESKTRKVKKQLGLQA